MFDPNDARAPYTLTVCDCCGYQWDNTSGPVHAEDCPHATPETAFPGRGPLPGPRELIQWLDAIEARAILSLPHLKIWATIQLAKGDTTEIEVTKAAARRLFDAWLSCDTSDLTRADYQIMLRRPTPGTDEVPELYLG